jgi:hypothetical protein
MNYDIIVSVGDKSDHLFYWLEEAVIFNSGLTVVIFLGGPLLRRVIEFIDRVVEAVLYIY